MKTLLLTLLLLTSAASAQTPLSDGKTFTGWEGDTTTQWRIDAIEENTDEKFSFNKKLHACTEFVSDLQPADVPNHTRALADVCLALLNSNEYAYVN